MRVGYGNAAVTPSGCTGPNCTVNVPTGQQTFVNVPNQPPTPPAPMSVADVQQVKTNSEGQAGRSAGAAAPPTDVVVAQSGISNTVQGAAPPPPPPPPPPPGGAPGQGATNLAQNTTSQATQNTPPPPPIGIGLSGVLKFTLGDGLASDQFGTRRDGRGADFGAASFFGPNTRVFSNGAFANSDLNAAANAFTATFTARPSPLYNVTSPPADFAGAIGMTFSAGQHTLAANGPPVVAPPYDSQPVLLAAIPEVGPPPTPLLGSLKSVEDTMLNALERGFFGMKLDFLSNSATSCSPDPAPCFTGDYAFLFGGNPVSGAGSRLPLRIARMAFA